ncbi:Hypothetical protein SU5_01525 [Salmonella enterica subsp. enterica serovar Heidelberg str. B182]|nr:Hypothetical protein SU5_01525 [Salmonella enterica subsp. enterica serovar Heidelberg str. B182]
MIFKFGSLAFCATPIILTPVPLSCWPPLWIKTSKSLKRGGVLPELWHWLYFLPVDRQSDLSADGHPIKGHFLPPVSAGLLRKKL